VTDRRSRYEERGFVALVGRETTVAVSGLLNQAVADLSADASAFLQQVHAGAAGDAHATAARHLRRLREFARATGAPLEDLPGWKANITGWRAFARLANSVVASQAG